MTIKADIHIHLHGLPGDLAGAVDRIEAAQHEMMRELKRMERFMAVSREELKQAMGGVADKLTTVGNDVKAGIQRLMDKVNAGQDFSAEADQLRAIGDGLIAIDADALAAGQDITPVPVPNPTPVPEPTPVPTPEPGPFPGGGQRR